MSSRNVVLTLSLPVTHICVNFSTVYNDMLVAKGLKKITDSKEICTALHPAYPAVEWLTKMLLHTITTTLEQCFRGAWKLHSLNKCFSS